MSLPVAWQVGLEELGGPRWVASWAVQEMQEREEALVSAPAHWQSYPWLASSQPLAHVSLQALPSRLPIELPAALQAPGLLSCMIQQAVVDCIANVILIPVLQAAACL